MSSKTSPAGMPDVQASRDERQIAIDKVGVKDVTYPLTLSMPGGGTQTTVATINMYVSLPHHQKGTHMSRFLEVLNEKSVGGLTPCGIMGIAREIKERLNAADAHLVKHGRQILAKCQQAVQPEVIFVRGDLQNAVDRGIANGPKGFDMFRTQPVDDLGA